MLYLFVFREFTYTKKVCPLKIFCKVRYVKKMQQIWSEKIFIRFRQLPCHRERHANSIPQKVTKTQKDAQCSKAWLYLFFYMEKNIFFFLECSAILDKWALSQVRICRPLEKRASWHKRSAEPAKKSYRVFELWASKRGVMGAHELNFFF